MWQKFSDGLFYPVVLQRGRNACKTLCNGEMLIVQTILLEYVNAGLILYAFSVKRTELQGLHGKTK